jgi:DNA-binding transcriptional regulator YiaG
MVEHQSNNAVTFQAMETLNGAFSWARNRKSLPGPEARRLLRERAGLKQQDVAAALGVTREAVALWERGARNPRDRYLPRYLEILQRCAREGLA